MTMVASPTTTLFLSQTAMLASRENERLLWTLADEHKRRKLTYGV